MISVFRAIRHLVVGVTAALAIFTPLWFAAAGLGTRFDFWSYRFGLGVMTFEWGPRFLFAALGAGALSLVLLIVFRFVFGKANAPGAGGWVAAVLAIVSRTVAVLAATLSNPPGERMLTIGFGTPDMMGLTTGAAFLAMGLVMREAVRLADDNAGFV